MEISGRYLAYILKEYECWTLVLSEKQVPYLGRCYAWWKDTTPGEGENMPFGNLPDDALIELRKISNDLSGALWALGYQTMLYGKEFLLNTAYLANEPAHNHHMHVHFIPRTRVPVKRFGLTAHDPNWGSNYSNPPGGQQELPHHKLLQIREELARHIE